VLNSHAKEFWRFSRTEDYGAMKLETSESLKIAVGHYE
jgi:hypothetical protein